MNYGTPAKAASVTHGWVNKGGNAINLFAMLIGDDATKITAVLAELQKVALRGKPKETPMSVDKNLPGEKTINVLVATNTHIAKCVRVIEGVLGKTFPIKTDDLRHFHPVRDRQQGSNPLPLPPLRSLWPLTCRLPPIDRAHVRCCWRRAYMAGTARHQS